MGKSLYISPPSEGNGNQPLGQDKIDEMADHVSRHKRQFSDDGGMPNDAGAKPSAGDMPGKLQ